MLGAKERLRRCNGNYAAQRSEVCNDGDEVFKQKNGPVAHLPRDLRKQAQKEKRQMLAKQY